MSEWPKTASMPLEDAELPLGVSYATRDIEVIPADLGEELYDALINVHYEGTGIVAQMVRAALDRYEREVGK